MAKSTMFLSNMCKFIELTVVIFTIWKTTSLVIPFFNVLFSTKTQQFIGIQVLSNNPARSQLIMLCVTSFAYSLETKSSKQVLYTITKNSFLPLRIVSIQLKYIFLWMARDTVVPSLSSCWPRSLFFRSCIYVSLVLFF